MDESHDDQNLVEIAYRYLLERILSGKLAANATISEVAIAKELGISRTPVHDALQQLSSDGLVKRETTRRTTVVSFTADSCYDIFEMRKFLEGPATRLAAGRMDNRQFLPLRDAIRKLNMNESDWVSRWSVFDDQFHTAIAIGSGNKLLANDISRYRLLHRGLNLLFTDVVSLQRALAEHISILDALEDRNGVEAQKRMVEHISNWQTYFVQHWKDARSLV